MQDSLVDFLHDKLYKSELQIAKEKHYLFKETTEEDIIEIVKDLSYKTLFKKLNVKLLKRLGEIIKNRLTIFLSNIEDLKAAVEFETPFGGCRDCYFGGLKKEEFFNLFEITRELNCFDFSDKVKKELKSDQDFVKRNLSFMIQYDLITLEELKQIKEIKLVDLLTRYLGVEKSDYLIQKGNDFPMLISIKENIIVSKHSVAEFDDPAINNCKPKVNNLNVKVNLDEMDLEEDLSNYKISYYYSGFYYIDNELGLQYHKLLLSIQSLETSTEKNKIINSTFYNND
jgi:hypothetical protein